jgi:chaperonin GroEL
MIKRGYEYIEGNTNPMHLKRGMQLVLGELLKILQTKSKSVTTEQQIQQVATISAADGDMGNIIGSAIHKIGKDGVINVSEYEGFNLEVEYKEGMEIDKGYVSAHFATEENGEAIIESPHILLTDMLISSPDELAKFLKRYTEETKRAEIVIIATDVVGTAMSTLLLNKIRGGIIPLACLAPGIGPRRVEILEDIATLTGGKVLYKDGSHTLENVPLDVLGRADRVIADKDKTRIVGGFGASEDITKRADTIREQIKKTTSDFEKSKLHKRTSFGFRRQSHDQRVDA